MPDACGARGLEGGPGPLHVDPSHALDVGHGVDHERQVQEHVGRLRSDDLRPARRQHVAQEVPHPGDRTGRRPDVQSDHVAGIGVGDEPAQEGGGQVAGRAGDQDLAHGAAACVAQGRTLPRADAPPRVQPRTKPIGGLDQEGPRAVQAQLAKGRRQRVLARSHLEEHVLVARGAHAALGLHHGRQPRAVEVREQ